MRRSLLLLFAALMALSTNAQLNRHGVRSVRQQPLGTVQSPPQARVEVMQMREPGTPVVKAPHKATPPSYMAYQRPAGAFHSNIVVENGCYAGMLYNPVLAVKPYTYYTFKSVVKGVAPDVTYEWDVQTVDATGDGNEYKWVTVPGKDLTFKWNVGVFEAPIFYVKDGDEFFSWTLHGYEMGGSPSDPTVIKEYNGYILSLPNTMHYWNEDYLKSSKGFIHGGQNGDYFEPMIFYNGPEPYGNNAAGWWFGKNGGKMGSSGKKYRIDGIAQAFEKPTAPYLLNQVVLDCAFLEVSGETEMTCKIYKLDNIPPYSETDCVALPDEPGELIAMGRATVTPETDATTGGLIFFTLYGEEDGLEYDITPTIDFPILVVVDGYNDPEQEDLLNFSALISSDDEVDEGFGELAYLKFGIPDEDGNLDHYVYAGLNNFFTSGAMKTGFTIFLSIENPYLKFYFDEEENGEYTFPDEGGKFMKTFDGEDYDFIVFESYEASADDNWYVTCNDDEVPSWLNITLEDYMNEAGEFTGIVFANVTAEPLPEGMKGRKAVVRFEYDGAYIDYTFIQGDPEPAPLEGDVNHDGSVNITDVNLIIDMILSGTFNADGDINHDGNVNISDINAEIAIILK